MGGLWQTLGYDERASEIAQGMRGDRTINVIEGPPGTGKTSLARAIGGLWASSGGSTIVAEGDVARSDDVLYPFGFVLAGVPGSLRSMGSGAANLSRVAEVFLGTQGILTSVVEAAGAFRREAQARRSAYLGAEEQQVLAEIERLSGDNPLLILADNLHWWDKRSIDLLRTLVDPRAWTSWPFLAGARLVAIQTPHPYQHAAHPDALAGLLAPARTRRHRLQRIEREGFEQVLIDLGAPPTDAVRAADTVHRLSGGHLALASRAAQRLADGELGSILEAGRSDDFLRLLLTERMEALGELGQQITYLLQVGAVLGLAFRRSEISCAIGGPPNETGRLLRFCREERILDFSEDSAQFVHDVYRQYFFEAGADLRVEIHEQLAECLRNFRPADYDLRALNALRADDAGEAGRLTVHAALLLQREGRVWRELPPELLTHLDRRRLTSFVEMCEAALVALREYRFDDCLGLLDEAPGGLPRSLVAEVEYLRAMCLLATRSEIDQGDARSALGAWSGYEETEPELGIRLARLLLYGLSHLINKDQGLELEARILGFLGRRSSFDPTAADDQFSILRSAGSLYQPEAALRRTRRAAKHFAPATGQTVIRRPIEYYRSLLNYGADLIASSLHDDAKDVHRTIGGLFDRYGEDLFPRPDFAKTNEVLNRYRRGDIDAAEAALAQAAICSHLPARADPFYPENALAAYTALAGNPAAAVTRYD
ncbi:MAG TPA: hypothetical protein VF228_00240, partial [Iamia sp.]